jgi:signal peptidase II
MIQNSRRRIISFLLIASVWVLFDLVTKQYLFQLLTQPGHSTVIISDYLRFTHVKNRGAVWGFFEHMDQILFYVNLLVVPGLFLFFLRILYKPGLLVERPTHPFVLALGLIMGGAMGNLYDRCMFGFVRDFIDVTIPVIEYRWPVFNIADAGITVGAVILATCLLLYPPEEE